MIPLAAALLLSALPGTAQAAVSPGAPQRSGPLLVLTQGAAAEFNAADVTGQSGSPISLRIRQSGQGDPDDIFSIGGLPRGAALSVGGRYNELWIVKRKHLDELLLVTPPDMQGVFNLTLTRAPTPTRPALARSFQVRVDPVTAAVNPDPSSGAVPTARTIEGDRPVRPAPNYSRGKSDQMMFDRAAEQFRRGDVSGARAIFEFLVSKGDAEAAFAMGESFDGVALNQLFIQGVAPDEEKAMEWYRRARQLGHPQADARLVALESMR